MFSQLKRITYNRGYVGKVKQGEKFPDRQFTERADQALNRWHGNWWGAGGTGLGPAHPP
ncbi:hypothetical protein [Micromonospora purpureochromogenes]|uniref:hypothetical protein n=1 Tax=Micromonospora purpureochromogenes TaxID=47872 RepID=UPI0012FE3E55|nr:hypothetical protein [Micromonospora purpureochromogenes]